MRIMPIHEPISHEESVALAPQIKAWAKELGFNDCGITHTDLAEDEQLLKQWLANGYQAGMQWMADHGNKRSRPTELVPGTISVISVRMDYKTSALDDAVNLLDHPTTAYISRYALGRDYHKLLRQRLQKLATKLEASIGNFGYRAFVDSAPVLEKAIARNAGLGWIGKHTLVINKKAGSWFFLGELYTDLILPVDEPHSQMHCGRCTTCIDICPTKAIVAPHQLDAGRCISYLTIEHKGAIPVEFRQAIGNRIFGCDDCQLLCPWNKYAQLSGEGDFQARHNLDTASLLSLFAWDEQTFLSNTEGMAIRRTGYENWQRNIAIALGNGGHKASKAQLAEVRQALQEKRLTASAMVLEHIDWALHSLDNS